MKTIKTIFFLLIIFSVISCGSKGRNNDSPRALSSSAENVHKKYQIKSGIVTFDNDMMGISQKSVLYFDDYGAKEREEKYDGDNVKEATICDGEKRYTVMYDQKTAYTMGDCYRGIAYRFDWNEVSKTREYKVRKESGRAVAGKDCDAYSVESGDYPSIFAGWNNICLYMETRSKFGTVVMKAVKIEENADVPSEKFQVPSGFEVKKGM